MNHQECGFAPAGQLGFVNLTEFQADHTSPNINQNPEDYEGGGSRNGGLRKWVTSKPSKKVAMTFHAL